MPHAGLHFGIFLAPFHRLGDNPTLGLARDLELIERLDQLGYDEAWIGEHHSAGWETIASPEIMIAAAAQRTRHIRLGSGVTSLPYHHPLLVAQRFVQLDHMTRGRIMLGCGPGALVSDAYMMGIEAQHQRRRMEESLAAIMALLACDGPVTMKTDWFELREARLHLAPYSHPRFPVSVASSTTPSGAMAAARRGLGLISLGAGLPAGRRSWPSSGAWPRRRPRSTVTGWTAPIGASSSTSTAPRTTPPRWPRYGSASVWKRRTISAKPSAARPPAPRTRWATGCAPAPP
jgi:limonene 1,2-monooxygenase